MNFLEFKKYLKELLFLALPILGGNIGQMLINLGDVWVAGHHSTCTLGAISVASAVFMTFIIAGIGFLSAVTPVLSNYRGQRHPVKKYLFATFYYSILLGVIFFILVRILIIFVPCLNLNPEILEGTLDYLKISSFSIFFIFVYSAVKEFLQAYEIVFFPNLLMVLAVFLNFGLNLLLVQGLWIFPELGTAGLAFASLLVRFLLGILVLIYAVLIFKKHKLLNTLKYFSDLTKVGAPVAAAMFIEFFGFNLVAVLLGRFETFYTACHNIIISIVSLSYAIPFSISCALCVKTGFANGAKKPDDIKKYTLCALYFIFAYAFFAAMIYLVFKNGLMKIFTNDLIIIQTGADVMIIAACFTLFDGIQGICTGALKGMKCTFWILLIMLFSHIFISIPFGLIFAYKFNLVLKGFWLGLALGLFFASIFSSTVLIIKYFKLKHEINV